MSNLRDKAQALVNALTTESRPHTVDLAYNELRQAIADDGDAESTAPTAEDLDAVAAEEKAKEVTRVVVRTKNGK